VLEGGLGQVGFELLGAAEPEDKPMEDGQKDGLRREVRVAAGIVQAGGEAPETENLVEVANEGRQAVSVVILPSHKCKISRTTLCAPFARYTL
jgi:hypothetical protein